MAYTYNLSATVRGGKRSIWDSVWDGSSAEDERRAGLTGTSTYHQCSMIFNTSSLAGKTITGINLTFTVVSGTIPGNGTNNFPICYKADSSTTSWKRSSTSAVGYIKNQTSGGGSYGASNTQMTVNMGTTLPSYGYVAGSIQSPSGSYKNVVLGSAATLAVTTNETYREYTLAYNANGGSGAPSSTSAGNIQVNPSCTLTVSSTVPTRTGYTFLGWSTSSTATSASYVGGNSITVTTAGTTTLYAVWKLQTYTVTYNKGSNGTGTNSTATKTYNVALTLKGATFTRTGYTQTSWYSTSPAQAFALGGSYTANADITLYPTWTPNKYTVSYNANAGTGVVSNVPDAQTKTYGTALTLSSTKPTRANEAAGSRTVLYDGNGATNPTSSTANRTTSYAFSNWNTAANGSGTAYASGASYTANAAATLYAQWTPTTTTASVTLPTITRTGYRFDGWFTAQTGGTQVSSPYTPGGNVTLYAHWTATASTVSAPNGTIGSSLTITITRGSTNSYTHDLSYSFGSLSNQSIATGVGTSYSWSIPYTLASQYPNTTSASCTITCVTKNGSTVIGTTTTTITLSIPYKPTISSFTASPVSANSAVSGWGIYLKGYSRVKLDVVAAAGYGASITNVAFSGPGISQTNSTSMTAQSPILSYANAALDYTVSVKDSRQQTTTVKLSDVSSCPYFLDYAPPVVTGIAVGRCDSSGNPNNSSGSFLSATPSFTFSSIGGRNSISSSVLSYGLHGSGSAIASKSPVTSGETYKTPDTSWAVAAVNAYDVTLTIADAVLAADGQTIPYMTTLPSVQGIWFGKGNDRLGLGGVPTGPGLHVDWNAEFNGVLDVTPRRCYADSLNAGWYRVLVFTATDAGYRRGATGHEIVFHITRRRITAGEETHEIKMLCQYDNISFVDEVSKSLPSYQRITKIRYTYDGTNGYVDICVVNTSARVTVDFDVYCEPSFQALYTSGGLVEVPASGTGTVLKEYTFAANTTVPSSYYVPTISFSDGTSISVSNVDATYKMDGRLLLLSGRFGITSMSASSNASLCISFPPGITIPEHGAAPVGICTNSTKTWGVRCDGSYLYITDGGGNYSKPQLTAGWYLFNITAFI